MDMQKVLKDMQKETKIDQLQLDLEEAEQDAVNLDDILCRLNVDYDAAYTLLTLANSRIEYIRRKKRELENS